MRCVETVIVGGGPAGAAAVCSLTNQGRDAVLLERSTAPQHKVCGEFLSVDTQIHLRRLGIDAVALGAVPVERISIQLPSRVVTADLPFRGLSLSRYRLDDALLRCAQDRGANVVRGIAVRSVAPDDRGWRVECDDGETLHCRHLVLATGKLGVRGVDDARDNRLVGLKMHLHPTDETRRALTGRVELALLGQGYAGLELVEDGIVNLCFVLPRAVVAQLAPGWRAMHDHLAATSPHLAVRLAGAEPHWDKAIAVVCPGGGYLHREAGAPIYRVGDRLAHIPPFSGDGLAIALASGGLAGEHIARDGSPAAYLAAARRLTGRAVRLGGAVSSLATTAMGRAALLSGLAYFPGLIGTIARHTRLPIAAH